MNKSIVIIAVLFFISSCGGGGGSSESNDTISINPIINNFSTSLSSTTVGVGVVTGMELNLNQELRH